ncbi:uncharacterized protein LOC131332791 [Rhododendron vialii]|uniref:uncharacterized protein LOC131332791 n=1 Tax=Rhododendron vialii TaxID=182163 RepID=UPI00265E5545|nr:uncharacterized protein LOC131332791 [Rhododendron vialii]
MEAQRLEAKSSSSRRSSTQPHNFIWHDHLGGHRRVFLDYFNDPPVYSPNIFRRRFRMNQSLFLRIVSEVVAHEPYFVQKRNNAGVLGLSSLVKITTAIRLLAYGIAADAIDEYLRIGESTTLKCLRKFAKAIIEIFSDEYLRSPNNNDIARVLAIGETPGFLECWAALIICSRRGRIVQRHGKAVASSDLWIWHAFFGLPGSNNDINVLERSSVFSELAQGRALPINYTVNGNDYTMGYYLADARFAIVRGPARSWSLRTIKDIMKACIILHNMIVEDERDEYVVQDMDYEQSDKVPPIEVLQEQLPDVMEFIQWHRHIRDRGAHSQLKADLIEHLWQLHSES